MGVRSAVVFYSLGIEHLGTSSKHGQLTDEDGCTRSKQEQLADGEVCSPCDWMIRWVVWI